MAAEPLFAPVSEIHSMAEITQTLLHMSLEAYRRRDLKAAAAVWMRDDELDGLYEQLFRELLA